MNNFFEIPKEWEVKKIKEFAKTTAGGTPSTRVNSYWDYGTVRWMSSGDLNQKKIFDVEGRITEEGLKNSSARMIPPKSVLIGLAGQGKTRGTVAMNMVELSTNQSVAAILPNEKFVPEFLYYNLDSRYDELRKLSTGDGGRGGLNLQIINGVLIPFPKLIEQKAIVEYLKTWDIAIEKIADLIAVKEKLKLGLMQQLLTGKKRLKGFKAQWIRIKLGKLANVSMGQSPESQYYNISGEGLPLIQGNADISDRKSIIRYWTSQITKTCEEGDILMTVRAPVGSIGLASNKACIGRGICSIKPIGINKDFLFFWLLNFENKWKTFEQGSTFTSVNNHEIKNLNLFFPKSELEQIAISKVISICTTDVNLLKDKLEKLKLQKKGLMQVLLTGKVRVKI